MPCSLPESLLIETAPPVQQHAVERDAGSQPETLRQALLLGEVQMKQFGLAGALGQVFVTGPEFVDQVLVQRGDTQPDLAGGDLVDAQLRAVARDEVLEQ